MANFLHNFDSHRKSNKNNPEILTEGVMSTGDVYKVNLIADVPQSLINSYVKKVKEETGGNLRNHYGDSLTAEELVKYVLSNFMTVDQLPSNAVVKFPAGTESQADDTMETEGEAEVEETQEAPAEETTGESTEAPAEEAAEESAEEPVEETTEETTEESTEEPTEEPTEETTEETEEESTEEAEEGFEDLGEEGEEGLPV